MKSKLIFIFYYLFLGSYSQEIANIPARIEDGNHHLDSSYIIQLYVGTPPELLNFEVNFQYDFFTIYRNQIFYSASYSSINGESEVFYFNSHPHRFNLNSDFEDHFRHCLRCDGMNLEKSCIQSTGKFYLRPNSATLVGLLRTGTAIEALTCFDCGHVELLVDVNKAKAFSTIA